MNVVNMRIISGRVLKKMHNRELARKYIQGRVGVASEAEKAEVLLPPD